MEDTTNVLDPPLEVVSGTRVEESSSTQQPVVANDGSLSNPAGSELSELQRVPITNNKKSPFIPAKKMTKISTFNVRTAKDKWRISELIQCMDQHKISIIGLQEHRPIHKDELLYEHIDNHLLVTASAWRNSAQAAMGGVGVIMNRAAEQALSNVEKISERIVKVTFAGNPVTTIFVVYSPTNVCGNVL